MVSSNAQICRFTYHLLAANANLILSTICLEGDRIEQGCTSKIEGNSVKRTESRRFLEDRKYV